MTQKDRVLSMLGMAAKAGKVESGEFSTERAVKKGRGRLVIVAPEEEARGILDALHSCPDCAGACVIGRVTEEQPGRVIMDTEIGGQAILPEPGGELLPRIC